MTLTAKFMPEFGSRIGELKTKIRLDSTPRELRVILYQRLVTMLASFILKLFSGENKKRLLPWRRIPD
jgi:hypothetical protein